MSMTREETRIELQTMKDTFEEYEPGGSRCQMALKVALTALRPVSREQVEKVWRGEWVEKPYSTKSERNRVINCKKYICSVCNKSNGRKKKNFCPSCGAPMTDEAVEMVMERLEALKDGKDD